MKEIRYDWINPPLALLILNTRKPGRNRGIDGPNLVLPFTERVDEPESDILPPNLHPISMLVGIQLLKLSFPT